MFCNVMKDCFAYNSEKKDCNALKALYCKYERCKFYKPKKKENKK